MLGVFWSVVTLPFRLVGWVIDLVGRLIGVVLGFLLMVVGVALCAGSWLPLGVPVFVVGLVLALKSL